MTDVRTQRFKNASSESRGGAPSPTHDDVLRLLRQALHPNDILAALQATGLEVSDLSEGVKADERTIRRWLDGQAPNRNHEQTIGALRVLAIHMLQRGGLPVELIARWLRLPDTELGFISPLEAIAAGRLADVVVAYDAYLAPRPGSSSVDLIDQFDDHDRGEDPSTSERDATEHNETGEFSAVGSG